MVLVSAKEMIDKAYEGHYAIPAFNTNNLEWTKCILTACQKANSPVIIQASEGAAKYMGGYKMVVDLVKDLHDSMGITIPVALHLDHGTYEGAKACIEAGFTSVMFDGSHYDIDENIAKSKEIIALAHSRGISVECEVGGIGGTEDGVTSNGELADPK
ncbi:MAG: class II fructose-bisphosphate aldolase, partial [Solobacterium sp.]|nr:class II fructose-bisphosphate aldolase [Solobacterium sp.]